MQEGVEGYKFEKIYVKSGEADNPWSTPTL